MAAPESVVMWHHYNKIKIFDASIQMNSNDLIYSIINSRVRRATVCYLFITNLEGLDMFPVGHGVD